MGGRGSDLKKSSPATSVVPDHGCRGGEAMYGQGSQAAPLLETLSRLLIRCEVADEVHYVASRRQHLSVDGDDLTAQKRAAVEASDVLHDLAVHGDLLDLEDRACASARQWRQKARRLGA